MPTKFIPLTDMKSLAQRADDYCSRYDIPEEVYRDLLAEQEAYWELLQKYPSRYGNIEDWEEAKTLNRFIVTLLIIRISEIMEREYKTG